MKRDEEPGRKLKRIELELKSRYQELRRRVEPGYSVSSKSDDVWEKTTDIVVKLNANPWDYIDAQFQACIRNKYPFTNMLFSEYAIQNYHEYQETKLGQPDKVSACQLMYLDNLQNRVGMPLEKAVEHEGVELYAWFRCTHSPESVLPRILKKYENAARIQIEGDSRLRAYLKEKHESRVQLILREKIPAVPSYTFDPLPAPSQVSYRWQGF